MKRLLMLMVGVSALVCAAVDKTASGFKLSSLVLPQGVSYELGPVTLTRTLDAATSASKVGSSSSKTQEDSTSVRKMAGSGVESTQSSGRSAGSNLGGSIGGSTGGSGGFSLLGLIGVNIDAGGKVSTESSSGEKSTNHNGTESTSESSRGSKSGSSSEVEEIEQYGQYHLKFSVRFKSKDLSDTFLVGGPNSRVILEGFSAPVPVSYTERTEPVRLRAEERVFFFDHPIADQVTLRDAKRMVAQDRRNAVTLSLIGDEFPVISERTKENVVSEITRIMKLNPNTLVAVDFGDVKRLSPWRVRRKFSKASGRKGERLTVRDALLALNGTIAEDEEMPDETFTFGEDGALAAVVDTSAIPAPKKGDVALVLVSVVENESDGASEVHFPTADFLKRPLSDFSEVRLVVGSLAELARAAVYVPDRVKTLRAEVESALSSAPAAVTLWKELLAQYEEEKAAATEKPQEKKMVTAEKPQVARKEGAGEGHHAGDTKTITLPGGATMEMIWCPPGSFTMGSPEFERERQDDESLRSVTLTKGFWLGKYEVTQRQWASVMGTNPSYEEGADRPVEQVSWEDCQAFISTVCRAHPELAVRLPTEAEWEYACRAGTDSAYSGILDDVGWYGGNSQLETHIVGQKQANAWGLHDMHGNVLEWCSDWYNSSYRGTVDPENTTSPEKKSFLLGSYFVRVCRGGSWLDGTQGCRSACRDGFKPSFRNPNLGFRLCCSAGPRD